jgi:WD40 repeat protein
MWVAHPQTEKPLHDSAVVCVKFDPLSSIVVASASTDGQVIVTSNHFPELDGESGSGPFGAIRE